MAGKQQQQFIYPASETQIAEWKKRHGNVYCVTVNAKDDDGNPKEVHGYFKKPSLKTIGAMGKLSVEDPVRAAAVMYNDCKISVDPEMDQDDEIRLSAQTKVANLFEYYQATVKKL